MTSFAFIFGMLPLVVASGAGGVSRQELGSAVVVGLAVATLFGVFLVPVLFAVVERIVRRHTPASSPAPASSPSPASSPAPASSSSPASSPAPESPS
jgi:HAE1 family hydrophobic/amphiphilic exporter-1